MKRILFALFMLTATVGITSVEPALAYTPAPAAVTAAAFTTKVNLMDAQIGAGNMTAAQTTWDEIHTMMLSVLGVTKNSIHSATTPAAEASYRAILDNQTNIYRVIWGLKTDLATNRAAIHSKLGEFAATIY